MEKNKKWLSGIGRLASYLLVAALACLVTLLLTPNGSSPTAQKLNAIESLIRDKFIGQLDETTLADMAAAGMVAGTGDTWSYYISAENMQQHKASQENQYVGVGITVTAREDGSGLNITSVDPGGSALEAGILPGDILTHAAGQALGEGGVSQAGALIRGKEGTTVQVTVLRNGQPMDFTLTRRTIHTVVAQGTLLENGIGYVKIANFNAGCAQQTIDEIEKLMEQSPTALIFDVRFNGGGYKSELVELLDYLLPEGPLFRSLSYTGQETVDQSDSAFLDIPMAVLINGSSYSAAEFFAAALEEYDAAILGGSPTSGKGYFQQTFYLSDGSGVNLSIGKYFTPNGVSLADVGGLTPEFGAEMSQEDLAMLQSGLLEPEKDTQLQAVITALENTQ